MTCRSPYENVRPINNRAVLPTSENRDVYYTRASITGGVVAFPTLPQASFNFEPVQMKITVGVEPIEFSFDGTNVHGSLDAGRGEDYYIARQRVWFRQRSDNSGTNSVVDFCAYG